MKKRFIWILSLLLLCGCTVRQVYGRDDPDINVKKGDTFTIELKENPTAGYQWLYFIENTGIVTIYSDNYVPDDKTGKSVGSGGRRVLVFKTLEQGDTKIMFVYQPAHQSSISDDKLYFKVHVF